MAIDPLIPLSSPSLINRVSAIDSINARRRSLDQDDRALALSERQQSRLENEADAAEQERILRDASIDAFRLRSALARDRETGNFGTSRRLLADRARRLMEQGRDTRHTMAIAALMNQERFDEVEGFLDSIIEEGQLRGHLPVAGEAESPFAKPAIKDFTPESVARFMESRDPSDLALRETTRERSDFTLGKNQVRYDAQGNVIAKGPTEDETGYRRIGQRFVDGQEQEVYEDASSGQPFVFTDTEGARRYLSSADITTPVMRTQEVPFEIDAESPEVPAPAAGQTLWELAPFATGPESTVRAGASRIPGVPVAEQQIVARNSFRLAKQGLLSALRQGGSRPLALELEQLFSSLDIDPALIDQPERLRASLRALNQEMQLRISQAERDAADRALPVERRTQQAAAASAMRNYLAQAGVPDQTQDELTPEERAELEYRMSLQNDGAQ